MLVCLWMVLKIEASRARPKLSVVTFSTGLQLRTGARERSEE